MRAYRVCIALTAAYGLVLALWLLRAAAELAHSLGLPPFVGLVATFLPFFAISPLSFALVGRRQRAAYEALNATAARERRRYAGLPWRLRTGIVRDPEQLLAALPDTPESRSVRVHMLAKLGRVAEARREIEQMPSGTPYERFERALVGGMVDFVESGAASTEGAAALLDAIPDGPDRDYAEVVLALERARAVAYAGGDPFTPLVEARARLRHVPFAATMAGRVWAGAKLTIATIGLGIAAGFVLSLISR